MFTFHWGLRALLPHRRALPTLLESLISLISTFVSIVSLAKVRVVHVLGGRGAEEHVGDVSVVVFFVFVAGEVFGGGGLFFFGFE